MAQPRPHYHLFSPFRTENYFSRQQDSNSDRWSRRRGSWPLDFYHHSPSQKHFYIIFPSHNYLQIFQSRLMCNF